MFRLTPTLPLAAALALAATPATAQEQEHDHAMPMGHAHQRAFSQGPVHGLTIGAPQLDLNGGYYFRPARELEPFDAKEGFFRLHAQAALGTPYLALASDLLFLPGVGATPTFSAVVQAQPLSPTSRLYAAGGIGVITGRGGFSDQLRGWVQAVVAVRTPVHEITPFVQVGRALRDGEQAEWLFGIAHPIAPYRFHLP